MIREGKWKLLNFCSLVASRQVVEKRKSNRGSSLLLPVEQEKRLKGRNKRTLERRICFSYWNSHVPVQRYYYNRRVSLVSSALLSLSLSLFYSLAISYSTQDPCLSNSLRTYVNVRASSLISYTRNSIRIGLEDASETSSLLLFLALCNRFVASFRPRWEEGEDCFDRERN